MTNSLAVIKQAVYTINNIKESYAAKDHVVLNKRTKDAALTSQIQSECSRAVFQWNFL